MLWFTLQRSLRVHKLDNVLYCAPPAERHSAPGPAQNQRKVRSIMKQGLWIIKRVPGRPH